MDGGKKMRYNGNVIFTVSPPGTVTEYEPRYSQERKYLENINVKRSIQRHSVVGIIPRIPNSSSESGGDFYSTHLCKRKQIDRCCRNLKDVSDVEKIREEVSEERAMQFEEMRSCQCREDDKMKDTIAQVGNANIMDV